MIEAKRERDDQKRREKQRRITERKHNLTEDSVCAVIMYCTLHKTSFKERERERERESI